MSTNTKSFVGRNTPQNATERPYSVFATPVGKSGKIDIYRKGQDKGAPVERLENLSTLAVTYYLYYLETDGSYSLKSSEYFKRSDAVSLFRTDAGKKSGKKVVSGDVDTLHGYAKANAVKLSTGCFIYCLDTNTGEIIRMQLTGGQRGHWFDFKSVAGEYPEFSVSMRESTKKDKKDADAKHKRPVSIPDHIIVFEPSTSNTDEEAVNNACNILAAYFGGAVITEDAIMGDENETLVDSDGNPIQDSISDDLPY